MPLLFCLYAASLVACALAAPVALWPRAPAFARRMAGGACLAAFGMACIAAACILQAGARAHVETAQAMADTLATFGIVCAALGWLLARSAFAPEPMGQYAAARALATRRAFRRARAAWRALPLRSKATWPRALSRAHYRAARALRAANATRHAQRSAPLGRWLLAECGFA